MQKEDQYVNKTWFPGEITISLLNSNDMKEMSSDTSNLGIYNFGSSVLFADNGYLYTLVEVQASSDSEIKALTNKGEAFWYYKVIGFNLLSSNIQPFDYDLKFIGKGIIKVKIDYTNTGDLICVGTYSELTKKGKIDDFEGVFYAKLDPSNGSVIADNHKKLDMSIVNFFNRQNKC